MLKYRLACWKPLKYYQSGILSVVWLMVVDYFEGSP